jgi:hypothetical protein
MEAGIAAVRAHRAAGPRAGEPFTVGALSGPLDLDRPDKVVAYLRTYRALGCDQVQVGFRSESVDHLCEQIARFAAEIAPSVNE